MKVLPISFLSLNIKTTEYEPCTFVDLFGRPNGIRPAVHKLDIHTTSTTCHYIFETLAPPKILVI